MRSSERAEPIRAIRGDPGDPAANWQDSQGDQAAVEAMGYLTLDLIDFLADLNGASKSLATAAVQLLPFGSRTPLVTTGLATAARAGSSRSGFESGLVLTPLAFRVMAVAAETDVRRDP